MSNPSPPSPLCGLARRRAGEINIPCHSPANQNQIYLQLFFQQPAKGDEKVALAKVKQKYLDTFIKTDLHFFLGTMQQFHGYSPNPWVIVGVLPLPHPPAQEQMEFL